MRTENEKNTEISAKSDRKVEPWLPPGAATNRQTPTIYYGKLATNFFEHPRASTVLAHALVTAGAVQSRYYNLVTAATPCKLLDRATKQRKMKYHLLLPGPPRRKNTMPLAAHATRSARPYGVLNKQRATYTSIVH